MYDGSNGMSKMTFITMNGYDLHWKTTSNGLDVQDGSCWWSHSVGLSAQCFWYVIMDNYQFRPVTHSAKLVLPSTFELWQILPLFKRNLSPKYEPGHTHNPILGMNLDTLQQEPPLAIHGYQRINHVLQRVTLATFISGWSKLAIHKSVARRGFLL